MIELTVEGIPQPVRVDPSFRDLPPERQAATVEDIRRAWGARNQQRPEQTNTPTGASFAGLHYGLDAGLEGLGRTAEVIGEWTGSETARGAGRWLRDATDAPAGYVPSGPAAAEAFNQGRYGDMARAIPGTVVEALPQLGGVLAGSALGGAVGGPAGAFAGGAAASGGMSLGQNVDSAAEALGRDVNDPEVVARGVGTTAAAAALDAFGARGGRVLAEAARPRGVAQRAGQVARNMVAEAGTESGQAVVEQGGTRLGTNVPLDEVFNPGEIAVAGATGGATRFATGAPGAAARGTVESVARMGAERAFGGMSPEIAESVVRLNDLLDQTGALYRERMGQDAPPDELFNAARGELEGQLRRLTHSAERQGWLDQEAREGSMVRELIETAVRHNRAQIDGTPDETGFTLGQGLGQLDTLTNTPAVFRNGMRALLTDLDQLSRAARKNRRTGPFEQVGRALGAAGSVAGGFATGGPMGALAGAAMNLGGQPLPARVGGTVGRAIDRLAGTHVPGVVLVRNKAEGIIRKSGRDPGNTHRVLGELHNIINDERLAARAAMGLPTDPDTLAAEAARAAERRAERERQQAEREAEREAKRVRQRQEAADAAETARHMAFTEGNPTLESKVRRARANAQARVAEEVARDLGETTAAQIKAQKKAAQDAAKAEARRAKAEQDAEAARQKAEQDRDDAEAARQIAASENIAFKAALARARAQRKVEQAMMRDLERDADRQAADRRDAATESEAAQTEAVEKAKRKTRRKSPGKTAQPSEAPAATPVAPEAPEATRTSPNANGRAAQPDIVETPNDRPTDNARGPMFGWQRYVQVAIRNKGRTATREDMARSVERLRERGDILDDEADAILGGQVDRAPRRLLAGIIADIADEQGWSFEDTPDISQAPPSGGPPSDFYRGVNKPAAWQGAADYIQGHVQTYRDAALAGDRDLGLAGVLGTLGLPDSQVSRDTKRVLARSALKASPEGQREFRAAALAPWLNGEAPSEGNSPSAQDDAPTETVAPDIEPVVPKRRGRPPGTGKNQRAAAAPEPQATAQPVSDGTVEVNGERVAVTDRMVEMATQAFARTATRLRAAIRDATDLDAMDQAEAELRRAEDRIRELREANAVWRARIIKEGSASE